MSKVSSPMPPAGYPDRDPQVVLLRPPRMRPFPVIADADELMREATYRARERKEPLLFSLQKFGMGRIYATDRVRHEVERNLSDYAGVHARTAWEVWDRDYVSAIRWVAMPDRAQSGFRRGEEGLAERMQAILGLHSDDAPTAELALHCAPCFVLTGNKNHLHRAGFGDQRTRKALAAAATKAEMELGGLFASACGDAFAQELWAAGSKGVRQLRRSPALAVAVLIGALLLVQLARRHSERAREAGARLLHHGQQFLDFALTQHAELMNELQPSLFEPMAEPSRSIGVARALARRPEPLSAQAIADGIGVERPAVLEVLHDHPAFDFWPGRGWTLGHHLETATVIPASGL